MCSTAGSPYQMAVRRKCASCFFYPVWFPIMLGRSQLKTRCPSAGDRPFCTEVQLRRFTWTHTRHTRHIMSCATWDKEKVLISQGSSPELEQIQSFKFVPHCTVTTAPLPSLQLRHCQCSILAAIPVRAPRRRKMVEVLWTHLSRA